MVEYDEDFKLYLQEISKYKPFTKEEQIEYFKRYQNGEDVLEDIFLHNALLVVFIAKRYFKYLSETNFSVMDLISYGNIGLLDAIKTYDSNSTLFSTWAGMLISQRIINAIRDYGKFFHIHDKTAGKIRNYKYIFNKLEVDLKRTPTLDELSESLDMKKEKVLILQRFINTIDLKSLDEIILFPSKLNNAFPINKEGISDVENQVIEKILRENILEIFNKINLTDNERKVLLLRYCDNDKNTYEKIANNIGLCKQRICQIEKRALNKIRKSKEIYELALLCDNPYEILKKNGKTDKQIELNIKL